MRRLLENSSFFFGGMVVLAQADAKSGFRCTRLHVYMYWAHQPHEDRGTYHTDEFLGMVLIMEVSFGAWYLLCSAASADGTYYGLQCQTMVLMCDLTFLQIGRA